MDKRRYKERMVLALLMELGTIITAKKRTKARVGEEEFKVLITTKIINVIEYRRRVLYVVCRCMVW